MDVYLVPVGPERYEPYCEVPDELVEGDPEPPKGFIRRIVRRVQDTIADAERDRREGKPVDAHHGRFDRLRARMLRWVAESIAEQRLLWHLRQQDAACLHYPDDLNEPNAVALLMDQLRRDVEKHRRWMIIDGILFVVSFVALGPVFLLIPGVANLPAFYFGFRFLGHYLSHRGASRGSKVVSWTHRPNAPLTELRRLLTLEPGDRETAVHAVAERLKLEHFVRFFQRAAVST
jgi:hypothetical protein